MWSETTMEQSLEIVIVVNIKSFNVHFIYKCNTNRIDVVTGIKNASSRLPMGLQWMTGNLYQNIFNVYDLILVHFDILLLYRNMYIFTETNEIQHNDACLTYK